MNFLKTIADKAKSAADSPTRSLGGGGGGGRTEELEGFICPTCRASFPGPDQLHSHFESHSLNTDTVQSSHREVLSRKSVDLDSEDSLLRNQIKALEEAKSLLENEVLTLHQQRSSWVNTGQLDINEHVLLRTDELVAKNLALSETVDQLRDNNAVLEARCKMLETESLHRNSVDDTALLKQELISVQRAMDETLREKEQELSRVNSEMDISLQEKYRMIDENRTILEENIRLKSELKDLRIREDEASEDSLQSRHLEEELSRRVQQAESLQLSVSESEHRISELNLKTETLRSELERLEAARGELDSSLQSCQQKLQQKSVKCISLAEELNIKCEAVEAGRREFSLLESRLGEINLERLELRSALDTARSENGKLSDNLKESEAGKSSLEKDLNRLTVEREELLTQIQEGEGSNLAIQQLTQENTGLQTKITDLQTLFSQKSAAADETVNELRKQLSSAELEIAQGKERDDQLARDRDALTRELEKMTAKCGLLQQVVQEQLRLAEQARELELLKLEREQQLQAAADMETRIKAMKGENTLHQDNIRMLKEAKTYLEAEKGRLEAEVVELEDGRSVLQDHLHKERARVSELEAVIAATENKVTEMRNAIEAATGKEKSLLSDLEEKSKTISAIEEEKSSIVSNLQSKQSILETLRMEKEAAEQELKEERKAKDGLELVLRDERKGLENVRKNLEEEKRERQGLEVQICSMQGKWEKERESTQEKMKELVTARELLITQIVQLRESLHTEKSEFESRLRTLKNDLAAKSQLVLESDQRREHAEFQLDSLRVENEGEKRELEETIKRQKEVIAEQYSKLSEALEESKRHQLLLSSSSVERDAALSRLLEMEAAVGAAAEERRGLLERCLAAEGETERLRNVTIELRRKMDDSQAAIHELGRENQSLQVELARQSGRKWKDDNEVTNCQSCSVAFSLTMRKHHCRNCGSIFCNECSSKQALMEGFKKPQRVCEPCFSELGTK